VNKNILNRYEFLSFDFTLKHEIIEDIDAYNDSYYKKFSSQIMLNTIDENHETKKQYNLGFVEIWHIDGARAIDDGLDIVDICDSHEQELYEYVSAIYEDGFIDCKLVEMPRSNDILVLHRIEIVKKYQGRRYGILISQNLIKHFGYNCGAILIRPAPLQFSDISKNSDWKERYFSEKFSMHKEESTKKLLNYWKKIDKKIEKSNMNDILYIPQDS
jgi:hypothetical protein